MLANFIRLKNAVGQFWFVGLIYRFAPKFGQVKMQKINLIALSFRENVNNNGDNDSDTHPAWITYRDKNKKISLIQR